MSVNEKKTESTDVIASLFQKYATDPYMLDKTHRYITTQLPSILDNAKRNHTERCSRITEMTNDQENFIQSFLTDNQYFYVSSTERFFYYDRVHYSLISEDDILYRVLSTISRDGQLMSWKQKTKINIMKRIREGNSLLKTIPESATIQYVIDILCPLLFSSRNEVKYFLTVLGDNILRKNTGLIHFIHPKAKHFIRELSNICQIYVGVGLSQTFRHKYHDHDYQNCRIIKINETIRSESIWHEILKQSILDIICIACHYSSRFSSSDEFALTHSNDQELSDSIFYLKNSEPVVLIDLFMNEYLDITTEANETRIMGSPQHEFFIEDVMETNSIRQITWKDMQYLWKHFLDSKHLPALLFFGTLKTHLTGKLSEFFKEDKDSFIGICSKYLPVVQSVLQFWTDTIIVDETESDFEVEEIFLLYKQWCSSNDETSNNMTTKQMLDIIMYFFPTVEIEEEKFISKIRCSLWDKRMDIDIAMNHYRDHLLETTGSTNISSYDAYLFYCKYYKPVRGSGIKKQVVSKAYFDSYYQDTITS